nr:chaperone protein dnaj 1, mitochondrial [Quercus suber]
MIGLLLSSCLSHDVDGCGYPPDAKTKVCPTCGGTGSVTIPPFTSRCGSCKGSGRIIKEHCMSCRGSGTVEGVKEIKVTIPAGVDSGDTIRVPGAGNGGRGSQCGNLFIKLKVAADPVFTRDGADIYVNSNISFTQAILGGTVDVPTLSGKTQLKIPKGVQPGQLLVLRGKVSCIDSLVFCFILFLSEINERQRAILEELVEEEINSSNGNSAEGNWLYQQLSTG